MIQKPNNWESVSTFGDSKKLPADAYECRIKQVSVQPTSFGNQLCILFDIVDGEYAGWFEDLYKADNRENKKWKGILRVWLPKDDGTEKDEWTKSNFKTFLSAVERSNAGWAFDWNEQTLVGKVIGVLFRNEEWEYEGKSGWIARPFRAISVERVHDGDYKIPADKPLKREVKPIESIPNYSSFTQIDDADGVLPF